MGLFSQKRDMVFFDLEVNPVKEVVEDIGACRMPTPIMSINGRLFHSANMNDFKQFVKGALFVCGHNIYDFDLKYISEEIKQADMRSIIDTLYWSALLFPQKPYHKLLKDDKIQVDELNNPLNDSIKAAELFMDEVTAFNQLSDGMKVILCTLLGAVPQFEGFFRYMYFNRTTNLIVEVIQTEFKEKICENADILALAKSYPVELAYCLSAIATEDRESILPYWVQKKYPGVQEVYRLLRGKPCEEGCPYCWNKFDIHKQLKLKFGYDSFRKYNGEPLQEKAVQAAVDNKSLLAIFPTGGGKSITFQLPALMASEAVSGLTVVISPLQSLMKDQVDNLARMGITDAVTLNGLLNPIERAEALERVESGIASILYIAPESLRSRTIERLLLGRNVTRFVIDEAHCFSSWGQEFRVDYLYIGEFISRIQEKKQVKIPVSCFTATAKQKVISDIKEYFKRTLDLDLELFTTDATRTNLRYEVLYRENDAEKYTTLRTLIEQKNCPSIVYVSRTKRAEEIAKKLYSDGFNAKAFHGRMERDEKIANQEAFIEGEVQIIVATSAFGMGVDKKDVKLVVHYDISDSLENYVQEAGRAGRDESIQAECYVLFNENDLDKHFILLNQTKLSISEIQQVWKGIKELTRDRSRICCSALEIARKAGWDDSGDMVETKVRTAIMALETAGYVKRGLNYPRVYADSIQVKTAEDAIRRINGSLRFDEKQKEHAVRIIKKLIATRSRSKAQGDEAEARVDYIADSLAIEKHQVIEAVDLMRQIGVLASDKEMTAFIEISALRSNAKNATLSRFLKLEGFLMSKLTQSGQRVNYKVLNEEALNQGIKTSTVSNIKTLLYFWTVKGYISKPEGETSSSMLLSPLDTVESLKIRYEKRLKLAAFAEEFFLARARLVAASEKETGNLITVNFSVIELVHEYQNSNRQMDIFQSMKSVDDEATLKEMEEVLLYFSKINAFRLEGGFLVLYNAMEITRLVRDNKIRYKQEDYKQLKEFYDSKTQQIHIVGEYANMMVQDYQAALTFVNDYFQMEYRLFLTKYFKGTRMGEISRNITPMKYQMLFENLSERQAEIINDEQSKRIVVAAGPGSGKTKILVHKLASLILLEDVKYEQLLMLTFSRAAAMEFKQRLINLIGNAAYRVEIKTFHSYCFDLLGKVGNLEQSQNVVKDASQMILEGEVELDRVTKNVLVLDEAQDMDADEFGLIQALMQRNEELRVIAVGDDDQNIYEFRGSDSKYMAELLKEEESKKYELIHNYRSCQRIVGFANAFVKMLPNRIKSEEIQAVKTEPGNVWVIKVKSSLEMSMAGVVEKTCKKDSGKKVAVLTSTNEQAYLMAELLNQRGFRARLIQSTEGFNLLNLAEIQFFIKNVKRDTPVIEDCVWNWAWEQLKRTFGRSNNLEACLEVLLQFEKTNERKYYTDLVTYLQEVRFEEFYSGDKEEICVSTIHKAKGREFDVVYMLVSGQKQMSESQCRNLYVGMTRAKEELFIFQRENATYFDAIRKDFITSEVRWYVDSTMYPAPEEIVLPFSLRDVWLGCYKAPNRTALLEELQSGDLLRIGEEKTSKGMRMTFEARIQGRWERVARCSSKGQEDIYNQMDRGYILSEARVQFVVSWRDKDTGKEFDVILPMLRMKKRK